MNIQALNAYQNNYGANEIAAQKKNDVNKTNTPNNNLPDNNILLKNPDKLITKKERQFFIKMFPENSEQLSKHVVFNKNGKVNQTSFSKGLLVDSRA